MIGYLLFGLTCLTYIVTGMFALKPAPTGDQYGHAYSALVLIAAYGICSLLLTINITANGGFNWISDTIFKRNIIVVMLWLGMMAGVAYGMLERTEYHKFYQLTGFVRWLSFVLYYGAIWLPLLTLIPYFLLLKSDERDTISPILIKIPLVVGCVAGFLMLLAPKIMSGGFLKSFKEFDERELAFNAAMGNIAQYQDVMSLLYYTSKHYDEPIRSAALAKIKAHKNLEDELIDILERGNPYQVFDFLDENNVEHPERFIEPIVKSFSRMTADMHEGIVNPYKGGAFDIGALLRVLEGQFNSSIAVFKPHLLKLQAVMETPPAKSRVYDDVAQCNEALYRYRNEIKDWLARH